MGRTLIYLRKRRIREKERERGGREGEGEGDEGWQRRMRGTR